jgi:hypothetical protein
LPTKTVNQAHPEVQRAALSLNAFHNSGMGLFRLFELLEHSVSPAFSASIIWAAGTKKHKHATFQDGFLPFAHHGIIILCGFPYHSILSENTIIRILDPIFPGLYIECKLNTKTHNRIQSALFRAAPFFFCRKCNTPFSYFA